MTEYVISSRVTVFEGIGCRRCPAAGCSLTPELHHTLPATSRTVTRAVEEVRQDGYLRTFRGVGSSVMPSDTWRVHDDEARAAAADQACGACWLLVWADDLRGGDRFQKDDAEYCILTRTYPPAALTSFEVHLSSGARMGLKKDARVWVWDEDGSVARRGVTVLDRTPDAMPALIHKHPGDPSVLAEVIVDAARAFGGYRDDATAVILRPAAV